MDHSSASAQVQPGDPVEPAAARDPGLDPVARALRGLRFGEVRLIVQDGRIVQIERLEKQRLR